MSEAMQELEKADVVASAPSEVVKYWNTQIEASKKKEKNWREESKKVVDLYEAKDVAANSFNVLYSNTETLLPAVYSTLPRPVVTRRYKDSDPIGLAAAKALGRVLQYLLQQPDGEYATFDSLFESAVLSALLPGRGVTRFRYDAEFGPLQLPGQPPTEGYSGGAPQSTDNDDPPYDEGEGQISQPTASAEAVPDEPGPQEQVTYETICGVDCHYSEFHIGIAKKWKDVPFIAFEYMMTKADVKNNFGKEWLAKLEFTAPLDDEGKLRYSDDNCPEAEKVACIYEVWSKADKKVLFVGRDYKDEVIKELDDPLGLEGFFPIPQPLSFLFKTGDLVPTPLYKLYEEQAKELNRISQRINKIISALKVRGVYDDSIKEISELMNEEDNTLLPAKNVSSFQQGYSLEKAIWLMPIDKLITVLQQLYLQRQQCKQVIYEITGISDILRGASVASETATAQNIKNQWGTLRLKRMQRTAGNYVRDCLRIMGEIAAEKFSEDTFAKMTGLPYVTTQAKQQAQQLLAQMQSHLAIQNAGQMPPAPGQPPAGPPSMPPEMQQQMQQLQQTASSISWGDILQVLRNDLIRNFKIDIETNSTVDPDATEDQQQITEIMTALAQIFQSVGPVVEQGALPLAALKQLILVTVRRFQFGEEIEEALETMPDQLPQKPDPKAQAAQQKAQSDQQKAQLDLQIATDKHKMEMQKAQADQVANQQKAALDQQIAQQEMEIKQEELKLKMVMVQIKHQEAVLKLENARALGQQKLEMGQQDLALNAARGEQDLQLSQKQGEQQLEQGQASHEQSLAQAEQVAKQKAKAAAKNPGKTV